MDRRTLLKSLLALPPVAAIAGIDISPSPKTDVSSLINKPVQLDVSPRGNGIKREIGDIWYDRDGDKVLVYTSTGWKHFSHLHK